MTDVLIRNVSDDDLARIDDHAAKLGISRSEYLRRHIARDAASGRGAVGLEDLKRAAELSQDLLDEQVMRDAWS